MTRKPGDPGHFFPGSGRVFPVRTLRSVGTEHVHCEVWNSVVEDLSVVMGFPFWVCGAMEVLRVVSIGRCRQNEWLRLIFLVMLLLAGVATAVFLGVPSVTYLRATVSRWGAAAPIAFVLLYALATLAPLPKNVFSAVGGALFGLWWGLLLVYLAAVAGAMMAFTLGRMLGRAAVERFTGTTVSRVDELLSRRGLLAVAVVRLIPVIPFTAINYAAGLTSVRQRDYLLGTAIGIIPGTIAYVALGTYAGRPASSPFLLAVGALLLLSVAGAAAAAGHRRGFGDSDAR